MNDADQISSSAELHEFEFPDSLIGRLRRAVHQFAGKWALRSVIQQQNEINAARAFGQDALIDSVQQINKDGVQTRKQIGELSAIVAQLNRKIDQLQAEIDAKK